MRDSENAGETSPDIKDQLGIGEALEEVFSKGSGTWVIRCVFAMALSMVVQGLESNVSAYIVSCIQNDFDNIQESDIAMLAAANYGGQLIGSLVLTPLGDVYGRRICLIYYNAAIAVFAVLSAYSPSLFWLVCARGAVGFFQGPCVIAVAYVMEVVPKARRGVLTNWCINVAWGAGTLAINLLAMIILPDYGWRPLLAITAIPFGLTSYLIYHLAESPRWLLSQGRHNEAMEALTLIAKINDTHCPCRSLIDVRDDELMPLADKKEDEGILERTFHEYEMLIVWDRFPLLLYLMGQWFCAGFAYSATVLYDGGIVGRYSSGPCKFDYGFNIIVGSAEIFGGFAMRPFIDRPELWYGGRKGTQVVAYMLGATGLLLTGFHVYPIMLFACISRAALNGATGVCGVQGAEVLEVRVRSTGTGFLNAIYLLGATVCSYWVYAPYREEHIAMGISLVCVICCLFTLLLPETAASELDTPMVYASAQLRPKAYETQGA